MDLSNQLFTKIDFSGQDLRTVPMHHSKFLNCNFDRANISGNDCSHSKFAGSSMVDILCRDTDFAHSTLNCIFKPKDAFGMTVTLRCETFRGMIVSAFWFYCWQQFSLLMLAEKDSEGIDPKAALIASLGTSKYLTLKRMFREREI